MTDTFTPWTLFIDVGLISALLLCGKFLRAKVRILQKLFVPPSVIAGFAGLVLGPELCGWLPFSGNLGTYAGILIAFVFGSLPYTSKRNKQRGGVSRMWGYSQAGMLLQWAFGGLVGIFVLGRIWPLDDAFGISMPAGYCGGHGTAAALGQAFAAVGQDDMLSLAMTAATVGIVVSMLIGLPIIRYGTRYGYAECLESFDNLSADMRTGLVGKERRESLGESTCSAISIDSITLHLAVIALTALGGYGISKGISAVWPKLELPVFSCAFIVGIGLKFLSDKTKVDSYICPRTIRHLSNAFTDYLVAFGIASIKLSVVLQYIVPLTILLTAGLVITFFYVFFCARKIFGRYWFEKAVFTWGWFTGTMAMGLALLRIADPRSESRCMDDYAIAYLFIAPVEIALITFAPIVFTGGYGWLFSAVCLTAGAIILFSVWPRKAAKERTE